MWWKQCKTVYSDEGPAAAVRTSLYPLLGAVAAGLIALGCDTAHTPPESPEPVTLTLSTNVLNVGDVATATLTVRHDPADRVETEVSGRREEVVILDRSQQERRISDAFAVSQTAYTFTSFELGTHAFSTGAVTLVRADGRKDEALLPLKTFKVVPLVTDNDTSLRDIKGLTEWQKRFPQWIWTFLLIALLAAIAGVLALRFLSKSRTILHEAPPPPPHERALRALRLLKEKGWIEARQIEPFYVELSDIVRRYIEDRFDLRAPEQTTEEFIREATCARSLRPEHQQLTADFLVQSDLVKFAKHEPDESDMRAALNAAGRLVRETIPATVDTNEQAGEVASS